MRHSLIRKCVCAICAVAAVMLFLVEDRMDDWVTVCCGRSCTAMCP